MSHLQVLSLLSSAAVLLGSTASGSDFSPAPASSPQPAVATRSVGTEAPIQLVAGRRWHWPRSGYTLPRRQYNSEGVRSQSYPRQYNDFRPYNRLITPSNLYRPYAHAPYYDHFYGP